MYEVAAMFKISAFRLTHFHQLYHWTPHSSGYLLSAENRPAKKASGEIKISHPAAATTSALPPQGEIGHRT
jgi:hypothetical protein